MCFEPAVAPQLVGLLGNMSHLLRRGKDNSAAFQILEAYLLLQVQCFCCLCWFVLCLFWIYLNFR
jgi:hypothetical protein